MSENKLETSLHIFKTRLETLRSILLRARKELFPGSDDMSPIMGARLAEDMLPFPYQITYACAQPRQFLAWLKDETPSDPNKDIETLSFSDLYQQVEDTIAAIEAASSDPDESLINRDKTLQIPPDRSFVLSGAEYVDEWLVPNFYFHIVAAYAILRARGLKIGKADYMAHLMPKIMS